MNDAPAKIYVEFSKEGYQEIQELQRELLTLQTQLESEDRRKEARTIEDMLLYLKLWITKRR